MMHRLGVLAKEAGFRGLFAGLGPRIVMTAGLVSGQFLIYGAIKDGASIPYVILLVQSLMNVLCSSGRSSGN